MRNLSMFPGGNLLLPDLKFFSANFTQKLAKYLSVSWKALALGLPARVFHVFSENRKTLLREKYFRPTNFAGNRENLVDFRREHSVQSPDSTCLQ